MANDPQSPVFLDAPMAGVDGRSVLGGAGVPAADLGRIGDFYVDTAGRIFYGPKGGAGWPTAFTLTPYAGWSPLIVPYADGTRRVLRLVDWIGGEGTKPTTTGYLSLSGVVASAADAYDLLSGSGWVTTAKIADGAVTTAKIADDAVTLDKLGADVTAYIDALLAAADAMVFKGSIDCSGNPNYPAADAGWTYRVSVAGKIGGASGKAVEAGDLLLCLADGTASGNQVAVGASWDIVQTNIDGAVVGPASASDGVPVLFDGTTGKLIKGTTFAAFKTALTLAKADVGLGSVDNTSDAGKPVSTAQQTALDLKFDKAGGSISGTTNLTSGSLGVGASSPGARMHAVATSTIGARIDTTGAASALVLGNTSATSNQKFWEWKIRSDGVVCSWQIQNDALNSPTVILDVMRSGTSVTGLYFGGTLQPNTDNAYACGTASFRFTQFFAVSGTINTSDGRFKINQADPEDALLDAWGDVRARIFQWQDAVDAKGGDAARRHVGFIAQEVEAAFTARGLDPARYALWCRDDLSEEVTIMTTVTRPAMDMVDPGTWEIVLRDGVPIRVRSAPVAVPRVSFKPVMDETGAAVLDEDGTPLLHPVPVMETVEVPTTERRPCGYRLGLRYDQCLVLETAWLRREMVRLAAKVEQLSAGQGA